MNDEQETYLKDLYYNTDNPTAYAGLDKFYRTVQREGVHSLSRTKVKHWLSEQRVYTAHRPVVKTIEHRRVIVSAKHQQWDGDTINMTGFSADNQGWVYILILIDIFTRYVWTVPLKTLRGKEMVSALKSVFEEYHPEKLRTDKGTEFSNKDVKQYLTSMKVHHFTTTNVTKANYAERAIKTIKSRLTKYMDHKQTRRWYDVLESVTTGYNQTYHRSIQTTPTTALTSTHPDELWQNQYNAKVPAEKRKPSKHPRPTKNPFEFKIGDRVKLPHMKAAFSKEYDEKWTGEVFTVMERSIRQTIPVYRVKDYDNEAIDGMFYENELQKVKVDDKTVYNIERVLRKRTRNKIPEVLVKWQGWPDKYNSWLAESDLQNL